MKFAFSSLLREAVKPYCDTGAIINMSYADSVALRSACASVQSDLRATMSAHKGLLGQHLTVILSHAI